MVEGHVRLVVLPGFNLRTNPKNTKRADPFHFGSGGVIALAASRLSYVGRLRRHSECTVPTVLIRIRVK